MSNFHLFTITYFATIENTSAYDASPLLVSRASRSAVASFSQLEADLSAAWSGPIGRARPGP